MAEKNKKAKAGGGKIIAIVAVVLVLLIGGGVGAYHMGLVHMIMGWERAQSVAELDLGEPVFHPLPQIRTDMKSGTCKAPFIRTVIHVQLFPQDLPRLQQAEAQIMDGILTHLRAQERQHVVGKEGSERLRFEIVQIIENIIHPAKVHTILFKELVLQ